MQGLSIGIQLIVAVKLLAVGLSHGIRRNSEKMAAARQRMGRTADIFLTAASLVSYLLAVLLVVPLAYTPLAPLMKWAALGAAGCFLISIYFHRKSRQQPRIILSCILATLSFLLCYSTMTGRVEL